MTDEEHARWVSAIHAEARRRVPEWEPWMTAEVGYAGLGLGWASWRERLDTGHGSTSTGWRERKRDRERWESREGASRL